MGNQSRHWTIDRMMLYFFVNRLYYMNTRKRRNISKTTWTFRQLFQWRSKRTQKRFHRPYHGIFLNSMLYKEPLYEIYTREKKPEKVNIGCSNKKVFPCPKLKKKTYVWRFSDGLFYRM